MKKKTTVVLAIVAILAVVGIAAGLVVLVRHEPDFYTRAEVAEGPERVSASGEYYGACTDLYNNIENALRPWSVPVTQNQVNSYFQEDFLKWNDAKALQRLGISDPRIAFEANRIRIGFRYGSKPWQTVISFDLRVWLVPKEVNVMAVEIAGRYAGALPISARSILELISEQARGQNLEVTWWRHNGNPVALVRFQNDRARPTFQLRGVSVESGKLVISGQPLEPGPQAMLTR